MREWTRLAADRVIVRSSAVGEDSEDASFAGQLDSVANVSTVDQLRAAILHVWGSQWSERALAYQKSRGTPLQGMGVIVQRQVDAQVSGVLFTVSPTSSSHMLLEYCAGLGEALVAGRIDPGRIAVARRDFRWRQLATADTEIQQPLMSDVHVTALALVGLDIERAFGAPQDIEWTIDGEGKLWIVQSRPITALRGARSDTSPEKSGSGNAVRSSLPFGVSGNASSATTIAGTMCSGRTRATRSRSASPPPSGPVAAPVT